MSEDINKLREIFGADATETDAQWIERMKREYPFFALPESLEMRNNWDEMNPSEREAELARLATQFPGHVELERIVDADGERFDEFYPEQKTAPAPSTNKTIEKFLDTYGPGDPSEMATLEKLIFNPVADYSQQLAREEEESLPTSAPMGDSQEDRINRFILSVRGIDKGKEADDADADELLHLEETPKKLVDQPTAKTKNTERQSRNIPAVEAPQQAPDNSLLSESLAKIYIKTHRYERAYEILSRLSLAFPEKSAYFADQLRFLRKLMFIESVKQKRNAENQQSE